MTLASKQASILVHSIIQLALLALAEHINVASSHSLSQLHFMVNGIFGSGVGNVKPLHTALLFELQFKFPDPGNDDQLMIA